MTRWTDSDIKRVKLNLTVTDYTTQPNNRSILVKENTALLKKMRKEMLHLESEMQISCVKTFGLFYPKLTRRLFAIPNGGYRDSEEAERLLKEGVLPGALDLFLSIPKGKFHGMYMEAKIDTGRLSDVQILFIKEMQDDYKCVVFRSVEQFLKEVGEYLK